LSGAGREEAGEAVSERESVEAGQRQGGKRVALGRIVGHFGVQGWLKVDSYTEPPEAILNYRHWNLDGPAAPARLEVGQGRRQGRQVVVHFDGYDTREAAARWIGATVSVERSELPELPPREYYQEDLLGLTVCTLDGRVLGRVDHFADGPAHGLMIVRDVGPDGPGEHWLPVTPRHLRRVDLPAGVIHVDWQPLED
jgi:16S rRNA processing protein RimM